MAHAQAGAGFGVAAFETASGARIDNLRAGFADDGLHLIEIADEAGVLQRRIVALRALRRRAVFELRGLRLSTFSVRR